MLTLSSNANKLNAKVRKIDGVAHASKIYVIKVTSFATRVLKMQRLGPVTPLLSKIRPGWVFCGTQTKGAGLMLGSGEVITMY